MRARDLVRKIDLAFEQAGQKDEWMHRSFHSLYRLNQLSHFRIFDISWFPGAQAILEMVDQLHTVVTPKDDFLEMAELLGISIPLRISKQQLAARVKEHPSWRAKTYDMEQRRKWGLRRQELQPLFDHLASLGYETDNFPRQVDLRKWAVDCTNRKGAEETLYLNENEDGDLILIQSTSHDVLDMYRMETNLFVSNW